MTDDVLSRTLIEFVRPGSERRMPETDEEAAATAAGADAATVLPRVKAIVAEAFTVPVDRQSIRAEPHVQVQEVMARRHPDLSDDALDVLGRYYYVQTM